MSTKAEAFAKLTGASDIPRFTKEINSQVQERYPDLARTWLLVSANVAAGRAYNHNIPAAPVDPGARPVLAIAPGTTAVTSRDIRDQHKMMVDDWSYLKDRYDTYQKQSVSLFGFVMNHLDTVPASNVRRHAMFDASEAEADFPQLWYIVVSSHRMTGAALVATNVQKYNELLSIKMNKGETLQAYCDRFDALLTEATLRNLTHDGQEMGTVFMTGMVNTKYRALALECLSAAAPLANSRVAIERAKNYEQLLGQEVDAGDDETNATTSARSLPRKPRLKGKPSSVRGRTKGSKSLTEEERFEVGRRNYLEKKKKDQVKSKSSIRCYECKKYGHYADKCPSKGKESTSKATTDEESSEDSVIESDDDEQHNTLA